LDAFDYSAIRLVAYPATLAIDPVDKVLWCLPYEAGATQIVFTTMQTLAHIHRGLDIPNMQMVEFAP